MSSQFIEKYEVLETLGKGSMGVVYKAKDPEIGRMVAIKTLKSVFLSDDAVGNEALKRFRQESRSAGRLHHPNIVTIFEAGRAQNGSPYIVMEYIEGKSLETVIRDAGAVEPLECFHYLAQIASAIDYALSQNIIHRDIKPSNIIVDGQYRPFLLDFGVAKLSDTSLTPAGTVVGTPSYMSPEQIRGEPLDGRSDLFSFAVVTYEMITGKRPFPGNDFTSVVTSILQKPPLPFSEIGCSLPNHLEGVLVQGLSRDREKRFSSATSFIDAAAQTLGISVDNTGLIGGFRPGMKLSELASREQGGRVRAPTLYQGLPSAAGSAQAGAGLPPNNPSGGFVSLGSGNMSGLGDPADGGETRLISPGQSLFQEQDRIDAAKAAEKAALMKKVGDKPKEGLSGGKFDGRFESAQNVSSSTQGRLSAVRPTSGGFPWLYAILAIISGMALSGIVYLQFFRVPTEQPKDEQVALNSGETQTANDRSGPDPTATPLVTPAEVSTSSGQANILPAGTGGTAGVNSNTDPGGLQNPGGTAGAGTAGGNAPVPERDFLPIKPQIPAEGFTSASLKQLRDEELAWLLSEEQADAKLLRLVTAEVGNRNRWELILRLMPVSMHQDYTVRIDVIKALSRSDFRSHAEVMPLIIAALSDSEFLVRGFAAKTLAAIGTPEAVKALEKRISEEKEPVVLKVIQDAIQSLKKDQPPAN